MEKELRDDIHENSEQLIRKSKELIERSREILYEVELPNGCFRHQVLLGHQSHSPGSYSDRRDRVEQCQ
jgi:hypothetical protein